MYSPPRSLIRPADGRIRKADGRDLTNWVLENATLLSKEGEPQVGNHGVCSHKFWHQNKKFGKMVKFVSDLIDTQWDTEQYEKIEHWEDHPRTTLQTMVQSHLVNNWSRWIQNMIAPFC